MNLMGLSMVLGSGFRQKADLMEELRDGRTVQSMVEGMAGRTVLVMVLVMVHGMVHGMVHQMVHVTVHQMVLGMVLQKVYWKEHL